MKFFVVNQDVLEILLAYFLSEHHYFDGVYEFLKLQGSGVESERMFVGFLDVACKGL